jgi:hypothetical protein
MRLSGSERSEENDEDSEANSEASMLNPMSYCSLSVCGIDVKRYGLQALVCLLIAEPFLVGGERQMHLKPLIGE